MGGDSIVGDADGNHGNGLISYEVLPQGFSGHAFLIAQPQQEDGADKAEEEGSGGEHIILHTLPIAPNTPETEQSTEVRTVVACYCCCEI